MKPPKLIQAPENFPSSGIKKGENYEILFFHPNFDFKHGFHMVIRTDRFDRLPITEKECGHIGGMDWIVLQRQKFYKREIREYSQDSFG